MKIKLIALAVAALVSGAANAALDTGVTAEGSGTLVFTAWDANKSFTADTGYTMGSFSAALASGGFTFNNAMMTSFFSTAAPDVKWGLFAGDVNGAWSALTTYANTGATMKNGAVRTAITNAIGVETLLSEEGGQFFDPSVKSAIANSSDAVNYTGMTGLTYGVGNQNYKFNFSNMGSLSNNSYANGLGMQLITASTNSATTNAVYQVQSFNGSAARAFLSNGTLNVAVTAVPEAETWAMLLAGLGMVGSIMRRRNRKAA